MLILLAVLAALYLLVGLHRVPADAVALRDSWIRSGRVLGPGTHATFPGLERVTELDPFRRRGRLAFATPEGAELDLVLDLDQRLTADGATRLLATNGGEVSYPALEAAIDALVVDAIRRATPAGDLPQLDSRTRAAVEQALSRFGDPPETLRLDYDPESPVSLAIRESEAWRRIREQRHDTATPILVVGLDGADWQIAEPLMEKGRLPNLRRLRERGAWGNIKALTPVLSPLLWTSVATGVRADRHGVLDFLVRDRASGQLVPVNSRFRRVRALWNLFSEAGSSVDVVAWWATWPAEPIRGHLVTDRVAYSLFDYDVPADGLGTTHPARYFEQLRERLVAEDEITFEDVSRFVDVTAEEFAAARRRMREDRARAVREPLNHLVKVLAATRNYHRITLDLIEQGQSDLTAVYYQGIDEVCHRFMHFMPPRLPQVDPRDVERYGRAVERFYEYQDELLGQLLEAIDPRTAVVVLSDHGFVNRADRPRGETADIEGKPGRWHRPYGVLVLAGPAIERKRLDTSSLLDIFPTVLYLAGLPVPADADGRVLDAAIRPGFRERFPQREIPTYEVTPFRHGSATSAQAIAAVDREIVENLRALGYIGGSGESFPEQELPAAAGGSADPGAPTVTAHSNLAAVLLAAGDLEGAEREIDAALRMQPGFDVARRQSFTLRVGQQRYDEALEVAEALVNGGEDLDPRFLAQIADAYQAAGRTAEGVRVFRDSVGRGRWAHGSALARLSLANGDATTAERAARDVLARDPLNEDAMVTLFRLAQARRDLAALEPLLRAALDRNPRAVMHLNWLAIARESAGDIQEASALLQRALDSNPDHGPSMANLGAFYSRHGRGAEAIELLQRALRINPDNAEARINLGSAFAREGRLEEAIVEFRRALEDGEPRTDLFNALARAHGSLGRLSEAAEWLRRSLELDPTQAEVRRTLAQLDARAGAAS